MGDVETLQGAIEMLEIAQNNMSRLYKYGLTPSDIKRLCNPDSASEVEIPLTITPLSAGEFGSAALLEYKGKQYVRKTQPILINERLSSILEIPEGYSPFRNEINVLRELNKHPELFKYVPVYYGHDEIGDNGVYIMEYLKGETLQDICEKRGMTDREWELIMGQIETILTELHKAGYVFNDVHPGNFFLCMDGNDISSVIMIDFGLTGVINKEKTKEYEIAKSLYNASPTQRKVKPTANRNVPAFNFHHLEIMKKVLENPFQLRNGPAAPKCKRPLNPDFFIQFKQRDYDTEHPLDNNQKNALAELETQIRELQLDLARKQAVAPKLEGAQFIRGAFGSTVPTLLQQPVPPSKYEGLARGALGVGQKARNVAQTVTKPVVNLGKTILGAPGAAVGYVGSFFTRKQPQPQSAGKRKHKHKRKVRKTRKSKH